MRKIKILAGGIILFLGLVLAGCVGYYSGDGYYDYPYDDYSSGYFVYPRGHHDREFREHQREFGQRPEWGEHQGGGGHHDGGEHHR